MNIAVVRELLNGERRVACTPEMVKKFIALGAKALVETGAGRGASITDAEFAKAGTEIRDRKDVLADADVVLVVQPPNPISLQGLRPASRLVGSLDPHRRRDYAEAYAELGIEALAMEFMPRITRAQSMDVLSSQSNLTGYKAVLDAAYEYDRAFPMMTTAAGTIAAARLFVMGVGVAGLQAIATAKRLGAQVSATDVRLAVKEQILSLGAKPVFVEVGHVVEDTGGHAAEMSADYQQSQAELVLSHIPKQDIVITTALIPGKPAPRLISDAQIATMRPGSVIVDLAAEQGGNVEGSVLGEVVKRHGVILVAHRNVPSRIAADASDLYAHNLYNFLAAFWDKEAGRLSFPDDDEIIKAIRLTLDGRVVNDRLQPSSAGA